jgi:hypothetical protein
MNCGYELRDSSAKGEGVFATQSFKIGDVVIVGIIEKPLNRNHSHASQIGEFEFVLHAGLTNKVNHSCDPNCGIKVNKCGAHDFVAIKGFAYGEEITFDYAMRNYTVDYFPSECRCGSKKCRGRITGWKDLTRQKKKEYKHVAAPYLLEMDARCSSKVEVIVIPESSTRREPALS